MRAPMRERLRAIPDVHARRPQAIAEAAVAAAAGLVQG
jgi:hypothetical protein